MWLSETQTLLRNNNSVQRNKEFASKFGDDNLFEACSFNMNNLENHLRIHIDKNQPKEITQSCVLGFNFIYQNYRYSGVAYQRSSCSNAMERIEVFSSLFSFLDNAMKWFPKERLDLSNKLFDTETYDILPGFQIESQP